MKKTPIVWGFYGAVTGIRTRDLVLTKDVLYLLSHNSKCLFRGDFAYLVGRYF